MQAYTANEVVALFGVWLERQDCVVRYITNDVYCFADSADKNVAFIGVEGKITVTVIGDHIHPHGISNVLSADRYLATERLSVTVVSKGQRWCAMCKNPRIFHICMCALYRKLAVHRHDTSLATDIIASEFTAYPLRARL